MAEAVTRYDWYRSKVTNPNLTPGSTDAALAGEWELIEEEWGTGDSTGDSTECGGDDEHDNAVYSPQGRLCGNT